LERFARHRGTGKAAVLAGDLAGVSLLLHRDYYTERERVALAGTEALTLTSDRHAPDAVFEEVRPHFNEKELSDLTIAIGLINTWNRMAIPSRMEPGKYQPPKTAQTKSS
jgi:alkylhydroperoxidase family enzyme